MALKLEQNPDQIFPENILEHCLQNNKTWWVALTKSRREKALAHFLAQRGIGYFLPMVKKQQPSRLRTRFSMVPLFPGYVFFQGNVQQRYLAYSSNHIARAIQVKQKEKLLDELHSIQRVLSSGTPVYPYDFLSEGQRVRITNGPMCGVEGIIDRKKNNYRLVLQIETIAQAIALDLEASMVEAA